LFQDPQALRQTENGDLDAAFTAVDVEEQNAGYQAAYSRLAASEGSAPDPVADIADARAWVEAELACAMVEDEGLKELIAQSEDVGMGLGLKGVSRS
jgi:exportin-2 (importin alpha re-exporter)